MTHDTGYVLKIRDYGEKDKIVTLFTKGNGKITTFAKSAARSKKRFGFMLEIGAKLNLDLYSKSDNNMKILTSVDVAEHFPTIRCDLKQFATLSLFLEVVDKITIEDGPNEDFFDLLNHSVYLIPSAEQSKNLIFSFLLKVTKISGFTLNPFNCSFCNSRIKNEFYYLINTNSFVCEGCLQNSRENKIRINEKIVERMLTLSNTEIDKCEKITLDDECSRAIYTILRNHIFDILKDNINSFEFFKFIV